MYVPNYQSVKGLPVLPIRWVERAGCAVRSRPYATARIYTHTTVRLRSRIIDSDQGTKVGYRKTRKSRRTKRNGLRATRVVVESSLRNFFFSESGPSEYAWHARTRAYCRRRMTPCGSIISQKSNNWFINAFAASTVYTADLLPAISDDRIWAIFVGYYRHRQYFIRG